MIVVTGASGQLGRGVVEHLMRRVAADQVAVSVRDPRKVADLAERGVRVRRGDYAKAGSLGDAFEGASTVLIVSSNTVGDDVVDLHRAAIAAAAAAGAKRILYTSHMCVSPTSPFPPMVDHAATEEVLRGAGTAFTALRNGFYASTLPLVLRHALTTGELRVPQDGAVAWTANADLAEVIAVILAEERFDRVTPPLTGPEAIDMARVAAIASEITGRQIRHVVVPEDEYRQGLLAAGVPAAAVDMLVGMFAAFRRGDFARADPTLADLLDRPATTVEEFLRGSLPANTR